MLVGEQEREMAESSFCHQSSLLVYTLNRQQEEMQFVSHGHSGILLV